MGVCGGVLASSPVSVAVRYVELERERAALTALCDC